MRYRCRCGHRSLDKARRPDIREHPALTRVEAMCAHRLVDLIARRPDLADLPSLGSRIAAGTLENA